MITSETQRPRYSRQDIADALDVFARERGIESRYDAMETIIAEALVSGGYLKIFSELGYQNPMSDDATF